jgi:tRNA-dihydrouridine synthase
MIKALKENLKIPITCKIRILKSKEKTIELAKRLVDLN